MTKPRRGRPKSFNETPESTTIQSLDRALTVLEEIARAPGQSLSELAERLEQSPATLYRVLSTLAGHDVVENDPASQTWHVGPGAFRIGSAFLRRTGLLERARPLMETLMAETGETANLGVERNGKVLFLGQVETHESIRAFFPPGTQAPMHTSGIGKALLSTFSEERVARIFGAEPVKRFTASSCATLQALEADLARVRSRGYAIDNEERTEGMRCIAAPVFDAANAPVAGISISGPVSRVTEARVIAISEHVTAAAQSLSRAMGAPH